MKNKKVKESKKVKIKDKKTSDKQLSEVKSQLVRALADYDNFRKRVESEKGELVRLSSSIILSKLLPIIDMLDAVQKHLKDAGLAIAISEFRKVLFEEGLEEIKPNEGDGFSEDSHEVVEVIKNGKKGKVAEVVLSGWKFESGKIIRHAKVKVYS